MRSGWRRILSWGLIAALSLVLLEAVLRITSLWPGSSAVFVNDPDVGYRVRPGLALQGAVTNSAGFNDVEHDRVRRRPGTTRLAFVGDSFVFGAVDRSQNFVSLFQDLAGGGVEVFNFGIPAAGPHTYLEILRHDAVAMDVDGVALVLFLGNDVAQAHPDFRTRVWLGAPRELLRQPWLLRPSPDYLYAWRLLRAGRRTVRERFDPPSGEGTFSRRAFLAIEAQRAEICKVPPPALLEAGHQGLEALLAGIAGEAWQRDVELFVVLAPDQFQVDEELRSELAAEQGLDLAGYDLDQPQRRVLAVLGGLGVPVLDLLPAFRTHGPATPLYLPRDSHWNEAGNRLAAETIYAFYRELRAGRSGFQAPPGAS